MAVAATGAVAVAGAGVSVAIGNGTGQDHSQLLKSQIRHDRPKNVIMLLGDGMGGQEITLARYYAKGAGGTLNLDALPFSGNYTNYSLRPGAGPAFLPDYVPDSASTGTEWATGHKTIDERISQGPSSAVNVPGTNAGFTTVLELAARAGKRTGNVSTAEITDATPAVLASHMSNRACQGPNDARTLCPLETKAAGGLGSITEQEVDHKTDVILGGGRGRFQQPLAAGGTTNVIDYAQSKGYRYVTDATSLDAVGSVRDRPVLGLFTAGNMTQEYQPLIATNAGAGSPDTQCVPGNRPPNEPSLAAMTTKAIGLLDDRNRDGFFLQVEGASIDKRDHAADVCGQIGETVAFDDAVGVALAYQRSHPDTLVVVTADHSHTSQIIPDEQTPDGVWATLKTVDGAPIRVSYGTAPGGPTGPVPAGSESHTGAEVPIAAIGPQAANINGLTDQTDLFATLLGRDDHDDG